MSDFNKAVELGYLEAKSHRDLLRSSLRKWSSPGASPKKRGRLVETASIWRICQQIIFWIGSA